MTQCRYVDTAVNALRDIDVLRDDKLSAETGVTVCFSGREFKALFEQLHRVSESLDGSDIDDSAQCTGDYFRIARGIKPSMRARQCSGSHWDLKMRVVDVT
jgi:hypothetical protein